MKRLTIKDWKMVAVILGFFVFASVVYLGTIFIYNSNPFIFNFKIEMDDNSKASFERALDIREKELEYTQPVCCYPIDCFQSANNPPQCTCTYMVECGG